MLNYKYSRVKIIKNIPFLDTIFPNRSKHRLATKTSKKLYEILEVTEDCDDETLRLAFVHLAKRFHPDSRTAESNALKFSEIEKAYREIRRLRSIQRENYAKSSSDVEEFDIKHTAPQHRHYLNYDVGSGTPSKRQKLHTMERAQKAVENVMEHRLKKLQAEERNTLVGMDKQRAKDIKTRYGMDRLVEDLIQEAMNKGEFDDLPGTGKPLKNMSAQNPYVDFVTHKLNQVLIENGFTPEWIQLSKEIREETGDVQKFLMEARNELGSLPLDSTETTSWENTINKLKPSVRQINKKIDKFNLLVPVLQKQMLHVNLEILAKETLSVSPVKRPKKISSTTPSNNSNADNMGIFDFVHVIFNRKS